MLLYNLVFTFCRLSSVLLPAFGYYKQGLFYGEIAVLFSALAWAFLWKKNSSFCLVLSAGIAAAGILTGVSSLIMLIGMGFSLAAWDLAANRFITGKSSQLSMLAAAIGIGALIIFFTHFIDLKIPFFVMVLLVILTFTGFDRFIYYIQKNKNNN